MLPLSLWQITQLLAPANVRHHVDETSKPMTHNALLVFYIQPLSLISSNTNETANCKNEQNTAMKAQPMLYTMKAQPMLQCFYDGVTLTFLQ